MQRVSYTIPADTFLHQEAFTTQRNLIPFFPKRINRSRVIAIRHSIVQGVVAAQSRQGVGGRRTSMLSAYRSCVKL